MALIQALTPILLLHQLAPALKTDNNRIIFDPPFTVKKYALPCQSLLDPSVPENLFEPLIGKTISAIDSPLYSIKWCSSPRADWKKTVSGPQCLTIGKNETALLKTNEASAPKIKWNEVFKFKLAITSEDNMTTHAELGGLSFLE